jgi:hypothetical protein
MLDEESEDQQQKAGPENMPKPPPTYVDVTNISLHIHLLEPIAKQQYEIKINQDKIKTIRLKLSLKDLIPVEQL